MLRNSVVVALLVVAGCVSVEERIAKQMEPNVGKSTYDVFFEAWGAPVETVEGDEIIVATWRTTTGSNPASRLIYQSVAGVDHESGEEFRLTFDRETKILLRWKYKRW